MKNFVIKKEIVLVHQFQEKNTLNRVVLANEIYKTNLDNKELNKIEKAELNPNEYFSSSYELIRSHLEKAPIISIEGTRWKLGGVKKDIAKNEITISLINDASIVNKTISFAQKDVDAILKYIYELLNKSIDYKENFSFTIHLNTQINPTRAVPIGYKEVDNGTYKLDLTKQLTENFAIKLPSFSEFNTETHLFHLNSPSFNIDKTKFEFFIPRKENKFNLVAIKAKEHVTNDEINAMVKELFQSYKENFKLTTEPLIEFLVFNSDMNPSYYKGELKTNGEMLLSTWELNTYNLDSYVASWYDFDTLDEGNQGKTKENVTSVLLNNNKLFLTILNSLESLQNRSDATSIINRFLGTLNSNNRVFKTLNNKKYVFSISSYISNQLKTYYFEIYLDTNKLFKARDAKNIAQDDKTALMKTIASKGVNGINGFKWVNMDSATMQNSVWKFQRELGSTAYSYSSFMERKNIDLINEIKDMLNSIVKLGEIDNITFLFSYIGDNVNVKIPYAKVIKYTKNPTDSSMFGSIQEVKNVEISKMDKFTIAQDFHAIEENGLTNLISFFMMDKPLIERASDEIKKLSLFRPLTSSDLTFNKDTKFLNIHLHSLSSNVKANILESNGVKIINAFRKEFQKLVDNSKQEQVTLNFKISVENNLAATRIYKVNMFENITNNEDLGITKVFTYDKYSCENYENALRVALDNNLN